MAEKAKVLSRKLQEHSLSSSDVSSSSKSQETCDQILVLLHQSMNSTEKEFAAVGNEKIFVLLCDAFRLPTAANDEALYYMSK
jgi:hypothetical protein